MEAFRKKSWKPGWTRRLRCWTLDARLAAAVHNFAFSRCMHLRKRLDRM